MKGRDSTLVAQKFLYPSIAKVSASYGKFIAKLHKAGKFTEIGLDAENITEAAIEEAFKCVLDNAGDVFEALGDSIMAIVPAGLRLFPDDNPEDKVKLNGLDAEACLDLHAAILEENRGFFTKLLRAVLDSVLSLSTQRQGKT